MLIFFFKSIPFDVIDEKVTPIHLMRLSCMVSPETENWRDSVVT
jgi:hypothetical protein